MTPRNSAYATAPGVRPAWPLLLCALLLLLSARSTTLATEQPAEFLEALRGRGYGQLAVTYLETLKGTGQLPPELKETWDLEMAHAWRASLPEAFDAADSEKRLAKSQEHLDRFLKEHPDHPQVGQALEGWAGILVDRGLQQLRASRIAPNPEQKAKLLTAARQNLEQARPRMQSAVDSYRKKLDALKAKPGGSPRQPRRPGQRAPNETQALAELNWLESRIKAGMVDYHLAQTYQPKEKGRDEILNRAGAAFDQVFQEHRGTPIGIEAHAWHGRCAQQLGDEQLALDIYDEVTAASPEDRRERSTMLAPLFAQVESFRLEIVQRKHGDKAFITESAVWLKENKGWQRLDGFQQISLELANAYLRAAKQDSSQRSNFEREAMAILNDMAKIPGQYQSEVIVLRRSRQKGAASPSAVKTFDEAFALGDAAADAGEWLAAVESYQRALALANARTRKDRLEQAKLQLEHAQYRQGAALLMGGDAKQALALLEKVARDNPRSAIAPGAASLALSAALNLYSTAKEKSPALARLKEIAQFTESNWPGKAEADDARLTLGQASLVEGNMAEALKSFETVKTGSQRYGAAQYLAAQCHWRMYAIARHKAGSDSDRQQALADRDIAEKQLRASLDAQRKIAPANEPPAKSLTDAELLLGELLLDKGAAKEAIVQLTPLVDSIRKSKPANMDNTTLRTLVAAVKAELAVDNPAGAGEVAAVLLDGPDIPAVNGALVSFARTLLEQYKQTQAQVIEAEPADAKAAEAKMLVMKEALAKLIKRIGERKDHSPAGVLAIAEIASATGENDLARGMYRRALPLIENDAKLKGAVTRVRSQLVGLLREEAKAKPDAKDARPLFEEALKQAVALVEANPRALEPKLEKGRILQAWSQKDPAQFAAAAQHWTGLRGQLARMRKKPPEYYEVVYYAALSMYEESRQQKNTERRLLAEQLLKATLVLSPKLNGPDMVARYKALLKRMGSKEQPSTSAATARS